MNAEERVKAVSEFGFSERQAGFLVTVMQHAGVCVPRQYARFVGTAYGQLVNAFFDKLVHDRFAIRCDCVHNRARVYRLHHKPLYRAIGEVDSRYRRPVPAGRVMERLMRLDGALETSSQHLVWLTSENEKVAFFSVIAPWFSHDRLPRAVVGSGASKRVRLFPDLTPVGVETTGRVVFPYVAIGAVNDEFRAFLYRHGDLLRALPGRTVRFLVPRHLPQLGAAYEAAFRDELARPISPRAIAELTWYFEQRRLGDVTELVGLCLWDIFSDNHDVIAADGRVADTGSFRGAGAFLDEYLTRNRDTWCEGDYMRFYLGTIWIAGRADLTPVYAMIFRRLKTHGADWIYHFPELGLVDLTPLHADAERSRLATRCRTPRLPS